MQCWANILSKNKNHRVKNFCMVDLPTDSTQRFSCEKGLVVDSTDVLYIFHGLGHHEQRKTWLLEKPSYPHIFFVEDYLVTGRRLWRTAKLFCFDTKTFNFLRTIIFVSPFFLHHDDACFHTQLGGLSNHSRKNAADAYFAALVHWNPLHIQSILVDPSLTTLSHISPTVVSS